MNREELLRSARNLYENPGTNEALKVVLEETYPELKEREDERIRKYIVKFVELEKGGGNLPPDDADKMRAYLERQKEQNPIEGDFPYNTPADTLEGEIENIWSKLSCENKFTATKIGFREVILHFVNYVRSKAPAKWSEEDEEMLDAMVDIVANSLYEPLCPRDKMLCWLKSLRPQPHWKPSEEQIQALTVAIDEAARCEEPYWRDSLHDVLLSLHTDLKKQM